MWVKCRFRIRRQTHEIRSCVEFLSKPFTKLRLISVVHGRMKSIACSRLHSANNKTRRNSRTMKQLDGGGSAGTDHHCRCEDKWAGEPSGVPGIPKPSTDILRPFGLDIIIGETKRHPSWRGRNVPEYFPLSKDTERGVG